VLGRELLWKTGKGFAAQHIGDLGMSRRGSGGDFGCDAFLPGVSSVPGLVGKFYRRQPGQPCGGGPDFTLRQLIWLLCHSTRCQGILFVVTGVL